MPSQNYATHRRTDPVFHRTLLPILFLTIIGSCVNLYESWGDHTRLYSASLIVVLSVCLSMATLFARIYALKAQDRAIRVEENFRHYMLAGKPFDPRITALAARAAAESMTPDTIKRAIKDWRADEYRV